MAVCGPPGGGRGGVAGKDVGEDVGGLLRRLGHEVIINGGPVGNDVGDVRRAAAGHADVEALATHVGGDHDVAVVDGTALGAMDGAGVAELDLGGDVVGGQMDRLRGRVGRRGDEHGPISTDGLDVPGGAVVGPVTPAAQRAGVLAGDDEVAG